MTSSPTKHRLIRFTLHLLSGFALLLSSDLASGQTVFTKAPTEVSIHNPEKTEGLRNRTTISVRVPEDAGAELEFLILSQLTNNHHWDWGRSEPEMYFGQYGLRRRGEPGLVQTILSKRGDKLSIRFNPAIEPGKQANVVFHSFNPDEDIYDWSTSFIPAGDDPIASNGPMLRISIWPKGHFK